MKLSDLITLEQKKKMYAVFGKQYTDYPQNTQSHHKEKVDEGDINYEKMMRHRAYRRRNGAIKQTRF